MSASPRSYSLLGPVDPAYRDAVLDEPCSGFICGFTHVPHTLRDCPARRTPYERNSEAPSTPAADDTPAPSFHLGSSSDSSPSDTSSSGDFSSGGGDSGGGGASGDF